MERRSKTALTLCGVVLAAWLVALSGAAAIPRNDYLLILDQRVGPYHYLDSFRPGKPEAYTAALETFGTPTSFKASYNFCDVTWKAAGVTVTFASAPRSCAPQQLFNAAWYGLSLRAAQWHNRLGLQVGQTVAQVRRLYPKAQFGTGKYEGNWLVLARRKIDEFNFIRLAVAINRSGRIASIEVPATYIY